MMGHPIESLMKTTMESLKSMVDVSTVVGEPVETKDGTVIVPVSRVSFGFVAGGGDEAAVGGGGVEDQGQEEDYAPSGEKASMPFTGGSGAGVTVRPVGFLVVDARKVRFIPVDNKAIYDRLLDEAPELLEKLSRALGGRECVREVAEKVRTLARRKVSSEREIEEDR